MNELQQFIANFSENHESYKEINEYFSDKQPLISNPMNYEQVLRILQSLRPDKHSLCYTWILYHLLAPKKFVKQAEFGLVQELVSGFLIHFQLQQVTGQINKIYQIASAYTEYLISVENAIYGIKPLQHAILKICKDTEQLCPIHREFAKLCLKAKCYLHSLPIIERPVTSFKNGTSAMDIISYFYYKGMILTGLQRYQQAIQSFLLVLSLPTHVTHKVHTESYKKLILLGLLTSGKTPQYPTYVSAILRQRIENLFPNYQNLAAAYVGKDDDLLQTIVAEYRPEFERDKNYGLILKLMKQSEKRRIQELNNTYLTLNFTEIMTHVKTLGSEQAVEQTLFQMISEGEIRAKIDSKQKMIAFIEVNEGEDDEKVGEYLEVIEELESQNKRIVKLMGLVEEVNTNIKLSGEYLKKTLLGKGGDVDMAGEMQAQMS